ncbi:hypothetical protein [Segniliparus rugosus]|uniref:Uncharacterized protein n=1 Tax=Segniliparus rugosus (strain ATCC BAA-974 / DSM 45345 / CCUG 50838 / CIP 108380 / JCM 13579 / CDC 945) TaxID=679197 RepID=E5XS18_SEGRC|nr:hypothetical protein [Segniliparus rugosus]EFV12803.1 hypothetical protein HMPREF9336_02290 [Segniliparus rugosus ATCC BAA-974]
MSLGEDQPHDVAGSDEAISPVPEPPVQAPSPSAPPAAPRRTAQLPQTADRFSFHSTALTTSSDGLSVVQVNRFGEILDVRHIGPDPRTDSWVLRFAEIGKIMAQARWTWSVALAAMGDMTVAEHFGVARLPEPSGQGRQPRAVALHHDFPGGVELSFGAPRPPRTAPAPIAQANDDEDEEPFPALLLEVDCPDPSYPALLAKAQSWFFSGSQDERVKAVVDAAGRQVAWYTRGDLTNIYTKAQLEDVLQHCLHLARREAQAWLAKHFAPLWQSYPTWLATNAPLERDWGSDADQIPDSLIGPGWALGSRHTFDALPEFLAQPAGRWQPHGAKLFGWPRDSFGDFASKQTETRTALDDRLSLTVDAKGRVVSWSADPDLLRWHTLGEIEWMLTSMYLSICKDLQLRLSALARQTNPDVGIRTLAMGLVDFSVHAPEFEKLRWCSAAPMRQEYEPLPKRSDALADKFGLRVRVPGSESDRLDLYSEASQIAVTCVDRPEALLSVSVGGDCAPLDVRVDPAWSQRYAEEDVPWLLDQLYQRAVDLVLEAQIRVLLPVWRTPEHLVVDRDVARLWFLVGLPAPFHRAPTAVLDD